MKSCLGSCETWLQCFVDSPSNLRFDSLWEEEFSQSNRRFDSVVKRNFCNLNQPRLIQGTLYSIPSEVNRYVIGVFIFNNIRSITHFR